MRSRLRRNETFVPATPLSARRGDNLKKLIPLLLAVAIGATSGLLGAWWPPAAPQSPTAAPERQTGQPTALLEPDIARVVATASHKPPASVGLALFCKKVPAQGDVSFRRFEQSALARKWGRPSRPIITDAFGLTVLPLTAGLYLLTAHASSCAQLNQVLEVKEGVAQQSVELFLEKGHAISGVVKDATNQRPVGGALISVRQQLGLRSLKKELSAIDDAWTSVADSLGRYRIEDIAGGEFVVRASAEGFADAKATVKLENQDAKVELSLEPSGFIEGTVHAMTGAATVKDLRDDSRTVFVNADGSFRIPVGPGDHLLLAGDSAGATGMVRVNVPSKSTVTGVVIKLERGGQIRGTASLGGSPAVCARVWIRAESDPYEIASAQVTANGSFTLERVPEGRYWLFGECADGEHGDLLGVEPNRTEPVELTLKQAAGLVVRVLDAARNPVAGAEVEVTRANREPIVAVTDALGHVELDKLQSMVVDIDAKAGTRESESRQVQLLEGQTVSVELAVLDTGTIVGRVDGPAGEVDGVFAVASEPNARAGERLDADGSFKIRARPGSYRVMPFARDYIGHNVAKNVELAANNEVRVDFVLPKGWRRKFEATAPGTIGASFDDGPGGVALSWVMASSPADKAGLKQGDLVLAIDGNPLARSVEAFNRTSGKPGSVLKIAYRRGGADAEVTVTRAGGESY